MRRFVPFFLFAGATLLLGFSFGIAVRPESYFTKGNKLNFSITSENGAKSYSVVKITDVIPRGTITEIDGRDDRQDDQRKNTLPYRMAYFSDSLHWSASALNHLNIPVVYSSNFIVSLRSDSLVYPYAMKVGDTLLPSSASELINGSERYVIINGRKVAALENVAFGGETVQAFRIESTMRKGSIADYGALGKIPSETKYEFVEWFVLSRGVVKSELKSTTGVTTMLLESVK